MGKGLALIIIGIILAIIFGIPAALLLPGAISGGLDVSATMLAFASLFMAIIGVILLILGISLKKKQ